MALVLYLKRGQGVRIGNAWVYAALNQKNRAGVSIAVVADQNTEVIREENLVREGEKPGPLYDPLAYEKSKAEST